MQEKEQESVLAGDWPCAGCHRDFKGVACTAEVVVTRGKEDWLVYDTRDLSLELSLVV